MNTISKSNNRTSGFLNFISYLFGALFLGIGLVNLFWGNDTGYGIFIILLSSVYAPPLTAAFTGKTGISVRWYLKVLLGLFILWSALGVGELFDKIDMMLKYFQQ